MTSARLTGGVSSDVLAVSGGGQHLVVKQALPKLRVEQEWLADENRIVTETHALRLIGTLTPELVPPVCDLDPETRTLVLRHAPTGWTNWRDDLLDGKVHEHVGPRLGNALAIWHGETARRKAALGRFEDVATFVQLRVDPFHRVVAKRHPTLAPRIEAVVERLLTTKACLVHGDFSPKNILVGPSGVWVLDWEVAHVGDPAFDLAFLTTHLLLKTVKRPADADAYRAVAAGFHDAYARIPGAPTPADEDVVANIGCLLLARVDGKSPAAYLSRTDTGVVRALGQALLADSARPILDAWNKLR